MNYLFFKSLYKKPFFAFFLFAVLLLLSSCSTKKAGFFNVNYHNLTTHYNVWWNGNESIQEGAKLLKEKNKDDYTDVLRVFQLGTKEDAISYNPQFDRAVEKGTKGIKKHSIFIKGREHVSWIRDCYLLIGKAQFYKQDYEIAAITFRLVMSQYKNTPDAFEAMIWYANCMVQTKQYSVAQTTLNELKSAIDGKKAPARLKKKMYPVYADCAIAQKKYNAAVQYLTLSIKANNSKKLNTRLYFILAQIYQLQDKRTMAATYYKKVINRRPSYEMEFNAKMNLAACYNLKSGSNKDIVKLLNKMLKDKKNEEYQDQIYYALGEVSMRLKDAEKACDYWKKSVSVSISNNSQKLKSSLTLANTYYDVFEDYEPAQQYYDTALSVMSAKNPNYEKIKEKHSILTPLVEYIRIINRSDSLIKMTNMSPKDRDVLIANHINKLKIQEQERLEQEMIAASNQATKESSNTLKGNWYFYNTSTVLKGRESFTKTWGRRALTDNWRLSSKEISVFSQQDNTPQPEQQLNNKTNLKTDTATILSFDKSKENDPYSKEYYLKDIFSTQEQIDSTENEIAKALLSIGFIYNDGLNNANKALKSFLTLCERYPSSNYVLPTYYQLFRIYDHKGDTPNANYYKNLLLKGFPDSDYANLIRDENYYKEMLERDNIVQKEYAAIYSEFLDKKYTNVILKAKSAIEAYRNPLLTPKFLYLEALSDGKLKGINTLIKKLEHIASNYPEHEITPLVKRQLELLRSGKFEFIAESLEPDATDTVPNIQNDKDNLSLDENSNNSIDSISKTPIVKDSISDELPAESLVYRQRDNIDHYFIILANDNKINVNDLRIAVTTFNQQYFASSDLKSNALMFTQAQQMITVQKFPNAEKAMEYYNYIVKRSDIFKEIDSANYSTFVISVQNYPSFYNQKNLDAYNRFFQKYYIK